MKKYTLFLTSIYRTGERWIGVFEVLDQSGRTFGAKAFRNDSRDALMDMHYQACDEYGNPAV